MGCLNDRGQFAHWFGNVHLSGPCNRRCYFCVGQFMQEQEGRNTLDSWPLPGIEEFAAECRRRGVTEVNLTGTNTDPSLYRHQGALRRFLVERAGTTVFGIRTNGVLPVDWSLYEQVSVSVPARDPEVYRQMMGLGEPPDVAGIVRAARCAVRANVVLSDRNAGKVLRDTLAWLHGCGVESVNLREPYGQQHVGDPAAGCLERDGDVYGCPAYWYGLMRVVYWDVHYCAVHSVNLYANGHVSTSYAVTRGCVPGDRGEVQGQDNYAGHRRRHRQWRARTGVKW